METEATFATLDDATTTQTMHRQMAPPDPRSAGVDLAGSDPAGLDTPALEEALTSLAGHLNAATCRFLVLVGEFDARDGWAVGGIRSCAHWLTWRCGLGTGTAREHVRVARALRHLPLVRGAFAAGRLSFSKVRALTRLATPDREQELVDLALVTPAGPLERYLRGLQGSLDAEDEARRHGRRRVVWRWDEDGSLVLTARLSPEDGAVVVEALEAARVRIEADEGGAPALEEPPDPDLGPYQDPQDVPAGTSTRRSLADALVTICAEAGDPSSDGPDRVPNPTRRPELIVHVTLADLVSPAVPTSPGARIEGGPALLPETARRLACDARIVVGVDGPTGETLDLGRARRFPTAALTRVLWHRDGGCRYPGCGRRRHLHAHHLQHWADGGPTRPSNLALLCGTHHRAVHEGRYRLSRAPHGDLVFTSPRGAVITPAPGLTGTPTGAVGCHNATIASGTATPDWFGDRLDLSLAVEATRRAWAGREGRDDRRVDVPAGTSGGPAGTAEPDWPWRHLATEPPEPILRN